MKKLIGACFIAGVFLATNLFAHEGSRNWTHPLKTWGDWHWHTPRGDVKQAARPITCKNGRQGYLYLKNKKHFATTSEYKKVTGTFPYGPEGMLTATYNFCNHPNY
ncbi:MAG: hypothetical protein BA874_02920 [Desulfuromonadales bacterium C00003068]|nr:hypothetical protein [Deltaproteobacteria bacterium]OEU73328.1 MAG: hypothetical protein BA874_02920 [Desulfuromonadales bacterium C00003068]